MSELVPKPDTQDINVLRAADRRLNRTEARGILWERWERASLKALKKRLEDKDIDPCEALAVLIDIGLCKNRGT